MDGGEDPKELSSSQSDFLHFVTQNSKRKMDSPQVTKKKLYENSDTQNTDMQNFNTQNSEIQSGQNYSLVREKIVYPEDFKGTCFVLVDASNGESHPPNTKIKKEFVFYEKIKSYNFKGILLIKSIGLTLYRIKFDLPENANLFVSTDLSLINLNAFIPRNYIYSYGVIRGIPTNINENELIDNLISDVEIVSVLRLNRRNPDKDDIIKFIPTLSVKIEFKGFDLPERVILNYVVCKVDTYFPPIKQCKNCGRIGHTMKGCRSKPRCLLCGDAVCKGICESLQCVLCGDKNHTAFEKYKCPKWAQETEISKVMTIKKISRKEVMQSYSENRFDIFNNFNTNFPDKITSQSNLKNKDSEVNKIFTQHRFSKVVKFKPNPNPPKPKFNQIQPLMLSPSCPVFENEFYSKVSDYEKIVSEITNFACDFFNKEKNDTGLTAMNHFMNRLKSASILNKKSQESDNMNNLTVSQNSI